MANHTYSKGLLYKKTLNSSGEVTGSVPLLLKTLGSLVIMSDGTDAETAISTAISNMVTPDETTIVTGQDGITISVKKSTSAEIDEILGDVPTEHTWEGYYTRSQVDAMVEAVDDKFNQTDIETALGYTPIASTAKGSANGVASLDANGLVPSAQLPSYVDDVIESATFAALPATGETGKIYVTLNDNKTYRWSGSAYVEISQSLTLGETSSTAFAGDKGKTAYEHVSDTTKHVPTGGTNAQYLKNTGNNTYAWASPDSSWPVTPTNNTIPGNKLVDDRFKVNETNILYTLGKTGKNLFEFTAEGLKQRWDNGTWNGNTFTSNFGVTVVVNDNKSIVVTGTPNTQTSLTIGIYDHTKYKGCIYSGGTSDVSTTTCISGVNNIGYDYGDGVAMIGDTDRAIQIAFFTGTNLNITFKPMICTVEDWEVGHDFAPYALPNYDLTYLEAEDRASLAEVVDSGAKNLLDTSTVTTSNVTFTQDSNSYITASPNNADTRSWNYANTQYKLNLKAGTYIFAMDIKTATSNTGIGFNLYSSNGTSVIHSETSEILNKTGMVTWQFTITTEGTYGVIYKCFDMVARLMLCTKAAFCISPKFVPYKITFDNSIKKVASWLTSFSIPAETGTIKYLYVRGGNPTKMGLYLLANTGIITELASASFATFAITYNSNTNAFDCTSSLTVEAFVQTYPIP